MKERKEQKIDPRKTNRKRHQQDKRKRKDREK